MTDLQSNFDVLGEGPLWEDGLDLGVHGGADTAPLRPDGVCLLTDARHDGKVRREVRREDASHALLIQLLRALQIWAGKSVA